MSRRAARCAALVIWLLVLSAYTSACSRGASREARDEGPTPTRVIPTFAPREPTVPTFERHEPYPGLGVLRPVDWPAARLPDGSTLYAEHAISLTAGDGARMRVMALASPRGAEAGPRPGSASDLDEPSRFADLDVEAAALAEALESALEASLVGEGFELSGAYTQLPRSDPRKAWRVETWLHHDGRGAGGGFVSPAMRARAIAYLALPSTPSPDAPEGLTNPVALIAIAPEDAWDRYAPMFETIFESLGWMF